MDRKRRPWAGTTTAPSTSSIAVNGAMWPALVPLADAIATNRKVDPEPIEVANRILQSF